MKLDPENYFVVHPFTNHKRLFASGEIKVFVRAENGFVFDDQDNRYLDAVSGVDGNLIFGSTCNELVDVVAAQAKILPFANIHNWGISDTVLNLTEDLRKTFGDSGFFFLNSGTEAIEGALSISRFIWAAQGLSAKKKFISFERGFHGSSYQIQELGLVCPQKSVFDQHTLAVLEQKINEWGPENISSLIVEPIQLVGGVGIAESIGFFRDLKDLLTRNKIHLILDETVTGFGRTYGLSFAQEKGISADFLIFGKSMGAGFYPISMIVLSEEVFKEFLKIDKVLRFGHTYSGHPIGSAVAHFVLKKLQNVAFCKAAKSMKSRLDSLLQKYLCSDQTVVTSHGYLFFVGCPSAPCSNQLKKEFFRRKIIVRDVRNAIYLSPPLTWGDKELDVLEVALKDLSQSTAIGQDSLKLVKNATAQNEQEIFV